jgi:hypothetical protein
MLKGNVLAKSVIVNHKTCRLAVAEGRIRRRDKSNPYHQSQVTVIFWEDRANLPIFIKAFASGGLITAKLIEIE